MRPIKMFGLAALAALMAMAFAGASSAMAESTALCNKDPGSGANETCSTENLIKHVHEVTSSKAKLKTNVLTVECEVLFLGDASGNSESGALLIRGNFTYSNCGSCTVTEVNGPVSISVLKLGHELGDVTGEGEVHVECGSLINCTYDGEGLLGHALGPLLSTGSANGEVRLEGQVTKKVSGGLLCPKSAELSILTAPLSATSIAQAMMECRAVRGTGLYNEPSASNYYQCANDVGPAKDGPWELFP